MTVKRIALDRCCGALIDVQEFFLSQLDEPLRSRVLVNSQRFVRLLAYLRVPLLVTLERPVDRKGGLPRELAEHLGPRAELHQKDCFDLTREEPIAQRLEGWRRPQVLVAGCETDVCVLHSVLGLLSLDYEVFVVEDLLFSSAREVAAAVARMRDAGAVLMTYKTLYYELIEAVDGGRHGAKLLRRFGPLPEDLPDVARW